MRWLVLAVGLVLDVGGLWVTRDWHGQWPPPAWWDFPAVVVGTVGLLLALWAARYWEKG